MTGKSLLAAVLTAVVFLTMGCIAYAQDQTPTQTPTEGEETPEPGNIYLYLDGELAPLPRDITGGNQMVEFAVLELFKGVSEEEKTAGYMTYVPADVKLQYTTVKQDRSEFSINLSRELMELSGDKDSSLKALAQIVKTVQEISGIPSVGITVAAEAMEDPPQDAYEALGVSKQEVENEIQGIEPSAGGSKTGLVLGIVFGVLGAAILALLLFFVLKKRGNAGGKAPVKKAAGKKNAKSKAKK